jgi:hypothetical protein
MGASDVLLGMVDERLLGLHTAFIGRVVSVNSPQLCSVQPLDKIKAYGQPAKAQAVITKVPVLNHVRHYELMKQKLTIPEGEVTPNPHPVEENVGHLKVEPIKAGDIVLCVCAERDIGSSVKGMSTTPPVGHHQIKDAVVVGLLGGWPHE